MGKQRVLVVEDSLTIRKRLVEVLHGDPNFDVIGEAQDGAEAIRCCESLRPNVITMDMMLPSMNGLAATEYIMAHCPTPILIVSSSQNRGELLRTYDALAAGAVDVIEKPRGDEYDGVWEREFLSALRVVSRVHVLTHPRGRAMPFPQLTAATALRLAAAETPPQRGASDSRPFELSGTLVVIGVSTGGPSALVEVLGALPRDFPWPVLVVLHVNTHFAPMFTEWLTTQVRRDVAYARSGERLDQLRGAVRFAPPDMHLVVRGAELVLTGDSARHSCRPSVDVLFESLAHHPVAARRVVACLLTGMGRDGAAGLLALRRAGARTIAQDEASSVVYGMPREAVQLGAAAEVLSLRQIALTLAALPRAEPGARPP